MTTKTNVTALKPKEDLPPAEMLEIFDADAGQGVSTSIDDNLVPFISILQPLSPQVQKGEPRYIEGAESGDILLGSLNRYWKGSTGILFQACAFSREVVEWKYPRVPGTAGFVGRHSEIPKDHKQQPDQRNPSRVHFLSPSGQSEYVDTRYHFGFILNTKEAVGDGPELGPMQAVIGLSSTGHTFSRQWMTQMSNLRTPSGKLAPSRARKFLLPTVAKQNAQGRWFTFSVVDKGWVTDPDQYAAGTNLFNAVRDGLVRAAVSDDGGSAAQDTEVPF